MRKIILALAAALLSSAAMAEAKEFTLKLKDIEPNKPIPPEFAFCQPDGAGKTRDGGNKNPQISWENPPAGTKSLALLVVDPDVPASFTDANKPGKTIVANFPRQDFYHWVLVDIPASLSQIDEGADSKGVAPGGKPLGKTAYGLNGQNDYASFMQGTYGGYDGPCPPFNDERVHHYRFTLYALDVETLGLSGGFTGKEALRALRKHTLATAELVGTYSNRQ